MLARTFDGQRDIEQLAARLLEIVVEKNDIDEFYITGADATACVKSTSYNLVKAGYKVHVISDCVTSYDLKKMDDMLKYYADKGCEVLTLGECMGEKEA